MILCFDPRPAGRRMRSATGGAGLKLVALVLSQLLEAVCQDTTDPIVKPLYRIGVHPNQWEVGRAVARYLTLTAGRQLTPVATFESINATDDSLVSGAKEMEVDFAVASPGAVSCLCMGGEWNPLATLLRRREDGVVDGDGASIVAIPLDPQSRAPESLQRVRDSKVGVASGKAIPTLAAISVLAREGISLFQDASMVVETGSDSKTLASLLAGDVDVGLVSAQSLATASLSNPSIASLAVLGEVDAQWQGSRAVTRSSTPLYPEWGLVARADVADAVLVSVLASLVRSGVDVDPALSPTNDSVPVPPEAWEWPPAVGGWQPALAYDSVTWLQYSTQAGSGVRDAYCAGGARLGESVVCAAGREPMGARQLEASCGDVECPEGAVACVCRPCVLRDDFAVSVPGALDGDVSDACVAVASSDSGPLLVIEDAWQREDSVLRCTLHDVGGQDGGQGSCVETGGWRWEFRLGDRAQVGFKYVEVLANEQTVQGSPFLVELRKDECGPGRHREVREPFDVGDCVCEAGRVAAAGSCVSAALLLPSTIIPAVMLLLCGYWRLRGCLTPQESAPEWEIDTEELQYPEPREIVGQGSFGVVELALWRGTPVAVKNINPVALVQTAGFDSPTHNADSSPNLPANLIASTKSPRNSGKWGRRSSTAGRFHGVSSAEDGCDSLAERLASMDRSMKVRRSSFVAEGRLASSESEESSIKRSESHIDLMKKVRRLSLTSSSSAAASPITKQSLVGRTLSDEQERASAPALPVAAKLPPMPRVDSGDTFHPDNFQEDSLGRRQPLSNFHKSLSAETAGSKPSSQPYIRSLSLGGSFIGKAHSAADLNPAAGAAGGTNAPVSRAMTRSLSGLLPKADFGIRAFSSDWTEDAGRRGGTSTRGSGVWAALTPMMKNRRRSNSARMNVKPPSIEELRREMMGEIHFLTSIRHPSIVTLLGAAVNQDGELCLVMEYTLKGSLFDLLRNKTVQLSTSMLLPILQDVVTGLVFLHSATLPVIHGDIKASNVLIDANFRGKVADAGITLKRRYGVGGSPPWMAPELLLGEAPSPKSDVYAIGLLMYETFARKEPYEGEELRFALEQVADKARLEPYRPTVPTNCPFEAQQAMVQCWAAEPARRPSLDQVWSWLAAVPQEKEGGEGGRTSLEGGRESDRRYGSQAHHVLRDVFPEHVAKALLAGDKVEPEARDCVTIFFSDIVNFAEIQSKLRPEDVARMLDRLYTKYDHLSHEHGVFKVETIGDAYMAVTNLVSEQPDHTARMARFALAVLAAARETLVDELDPSKGSVITRAGMHSGPVVADVVGLRNPRYCLFGDTVNTASRMESNSMAGRLHCSEFTAQNLRRQSVGLQLESRGFIEVKGKGKMQTFWVNAAAGMAKEISMHSRNSEADDPIRVGEAITVAVEGAADHSKHPAADISPSRQLAATMSGRKNPTLMHRIQSMRPFAHARQSSITGLRHSGNVKPLGHTASMLK